jgi:hypothetical protein
MDIPTVPGSLYTVATKTTCDITDTATGTPIDSVSSGSVTFTAQGSVTTLSDPAATYSKVNFKNAAAALRMLGGGDQLPIGYLAAEFLASYGAEASINTGVYPNSETGWLVDGVFTANEESWSVSAYAPPNRYYFCCGFYGKGWGSVCVGQNGSNGPPITYGYEGNLRFAAYVNFKNSRSVNFEREGSVKSFELGSAISQMQDSIYVFGRSNNNCYYRLWNLKISQGEEIIRDYAMCLDDLGKPCLFDKISKKAIYNTINKGTLIVGMNCRQAVQLAKLPAGGGSLTISLPENYTDDDAVVEALSTATENGWVFEIQTYTTDGASASTFALRRIWVKKIASPDGAYVDATGARWHVEWCQNVLGAEPSDLGYEPFRSVVVALAEWELTPYVYPEEETLRI